MDGYDTACGSDDDDMRRMKTRTRMRMRSMMTVMTLIFGLNRWLSMPAHWYVMVTIEAAPSVCLPVGAWGCSQSSFLCAVGALVACSYCSWYAVSF